MTTLAGSHGQLRIGGLIAARCIDWQLSADREFAERTPIYRWRERSRALRTTTTGTATILYDPAEPVTAAMLGAVRNNEPPALQFILYSDRAGLTGYSFWAYINLLGTTVAPASASRSRISFQATGPVLTLT
jgi:hypothetical protein